MQALLRPRPVVGLVGGADEVDALVEPFRELLADRGLDLEREDAWIVIDLGNSVDAWEDFSVPLALAGAGSGNDFARLAAAIAAIDPESGRPPLARVLERAADVAAALVGHLVVEAPPTGPFPEQLRTRLYNHAIAELPNTLDRVPEELFAEWSLGALRLVARTIRGLAPEVRPWARREQMAMLDVAELIEVLASVRPSFADAAFGWLAEASRSAHDAAVVDRIADRVGFVPPPRPAAVRRLGAPVDLAAHRHGAEPVRYRTTEDGRLWAIAADVIVGQWVRAVAHGYATPEA